MAFSQRVSIVSCKNMDLQNLTQCALPHCCVAQPFQHLSVLHLEVSVGCGDGEKAELTVEGGDGGRLPGNREGSSRVPDGCQACPARGAGMTVLDNGAVRLGVLSANRREDEPLDCLTPVPQWLGRAAA